MENRLYTHKKMERLTILRNHLLSLHLQMLGIFHWSPIHWRLKCLLCTYKMKTCQISVGRTQVHRQDQYVIRESRGHSRGEDDEEFVEDLDESAGLFSATNETQINQEDWPEDEGTSKSCVVCESLRWNGEGHVVRDIEEWVPGSFSRAAGTIGSTLFMIILTVCMCYNTVLYIRYLFGREDEVMHLTSFMSFSVSLSSVALICVYAKTRYYLTGYGTYLDTESGPRHWGWCGVLHQDYMTRRLQYLRRDNGFCLPSASFHTSCLLWPALNMVFEIVYFTNLNQIQPVMKQTFIVIEVSAYTAGMLLFGVFCYILFLLRCSFETECNLLLAFFAENEGHLDRCRMRLADTYRDYRLYRSAVRAWIAFIIATGILGLTVHLSWNYDVYSGNEKLDVSGKDLIVLNVLIFSEKLMILTLPVLAVGGMDLGYLWRHFHLVLSRSRRSEHEYFWERLAYYLRDLNENDKSTGFTMFISVVSLYTGLRLGAQNLDYSRIPWN